MVFVSKIKGVWRREWRGAGWGGSAGPPPLYLCPQGEPACFGGLVASQRALVLSPRAQALPTGSQGLGQSLWDVSPPFALLPWIPLPMSSKEIFRFCGSFAVVFSRKFLTFTKVCERHPGLIAEGEAGVATQGVPHLDIPLGDTPHSAQCHRGLSCSVAFPWGHLHPPSWEDGLGWAIQESPMWVPKDHSRDGAPVHLVVLVGAVLVWGQVSHPLHQVLQLLRTVLELLLHAPGLDRIVLESEREEPPWWGK